MTEFDKKLIEKAESFSRYDYRDINILIKIAETTEAKRRLIEIQSELYDFVLETI